MLLAVGVGLTLAVANAFIKAGVSQILSFIIAIPIFIIMVIVAFFKISEMSLHEFIAKLIRTHFLDTTKKFQINYSRPDPVSIALAKARKTDHETVISQKDLILDKEKLDKLQTFDE